MENLEFCRKILNIMKRNRREEGIAGAMSRMEMGHDFGKLENAGPSFVLIS